MTGSAGDQDNVVSFYPRRRRRPRKPRPKASGTARGYGYPHARLRAWWKPQVEAGLVQCHAVVCLEPSRWIKPGSEWHLGHTPARTAWTGPEHAKCNLSEAAIRGNKMRDDGGPPRRRSRIW